VLDILENQIASLKNKKTTKLIHRTIVLGGAGSGKSTLIKEIQKRISQNFGDASFKVLAPTGVAALNINGSTIHSALKIGISKKNNKPNEIKELRNQNLRNFKELMKNCKFLIFDEVGMIGCNLLEMIELRCKEVTSNSAKEFGGLFIYFFGDFNQLPPVNDIPVYQTSFRNSSKNKKLSESSNKNNNNNGRICFLSIQKCIFLDKVFRQNDEKEKEFCQVLDHLSRCQVTIDDWKVLMRRSKNYLREDELNEFDNAIRLYTTNDSVQNYNNRKLESLLKPVHYLKAINNCDKAKEANLVAFPVILQICVGAKVMLRTNIWTEVGLVNGAIGVIKDIIYLKGEIPPNHLPKVIMVEFENYTGPSINNLVPLIPITHIWDEDGIHCSRIQFSLVLAYALTIHKSQSLTLPKIIVDIGDKELCKGLTYTAVSRVRSINDILFIKEYDYHRFYRLRNSNLLEDIEKEIERFKKL
jgi:ATP-dependent exoDNAse (exonuclease V) alpha subunit